MSEALEQRIAELEVRVAFQDDTIDALNAALASQQQQLSQLQQAVSLLAQRQKSSPARCQQKVATSHRRHIINSAVATPGSVVVTAVWVSG